MIPVSDNRDAPDCLGRNKIIYLFFYLYIKGYEMIFGLKPLLVMLG